MSALACIPGIFQFWRLPKVECCPVLWQCVCARARAGAFGVRGVAGRGQTWRRALAGAPCVCCCWRVHSELRRSCCILALECVAHVHNSHARMRAHTNTHTRTHIRTHTRTHIYTHSYTCTALGPSAEPRSLPGAAGADPAAVRLPLAGVGSEKDGVQRPHR